MLEAWKIGVRVSVLDSASMGLRAISRAFNGAETDALKLEKRIKSIHGQMLKGGLMIGAGVGMLAMFKAPLEEAKKFQTETTRFESLGFGDKVNAQAVQYAQGMKTIGTSTRDNMALLSDAMAVFKNLDHAKFAAPLMAKMKFGNEALFGAEKGGANDKKFMDMLKVIEFRGGLSSEKEFASQANFVQKVITGSRNRVDATAMLQALKTGGVALSRRSNEQFYLGGEPLIQEFGGSRYGTAAMSIYQNLVQSRGTVTAQQELYRLGLLDKKKVTFNKLGMLKKALPGAFKGSDILEKEGELSLLKEVLLPAFKAKGITTDEGIIREFGMILGNRTGSGLMARIYQQRSQIEMQSAANRNALDIDGTSAAGNKTLAGKEIDFQAKFNNLLLELGKTVLPLACAALDRLIPLVKSITDWMTQHKTAVKYLAFAFVGLGAALIFGGTVTLLAGAFRGLNLAMGMSGIGGAAGISRLGMSLSQASTGFGKMQVAMAGFIAWQVGYFVGGQIYDHFYAGNKYGDRVGAIGAHVMSFLGDKDAKEAVASMNGKGPANHSGDFHGLPASVRGAGMVHTTINIDGRRVAEAITPHQTRAANRPQTGVSGFDSSRHATPVGVTSSW